MMLCANDRSPATVCGALVCVSELDIWKFEDSLTTADEQVDDPNFGLSLRGGSRASAN